VLTYPEFEASYNGEVNLKLGSQLANGRIGEASQTLRDLWRQAPASPEAEDAARQLRVLDERGLGGAQATAQDRVERAERLLAAGRSDAARSELDSLGKSALGAELGDRILKVQAGAARRAGRPDLALTVVNRALTELPPDRRAPWLLDLARLQQHRNKDAGIAVLDRLVREYPQSPEAAEALVRFAPLPSGNLAMYYPEANALIPRRSDPASGTPVFKSTAVRLVPVPG